MAVTAAQARRAVRRAELSWAPEVKDPRAEKGQRYGHHGLLSLLMMAFACGLICLRRLEHHRPRGLVHRKLKSLCLVLGAVGRTWGQRCLPPASSWTEAALETAMAKVVNGDAIRDLLEAGRGRLSTTVVERMKALGVPLEGKIAPTYPVETWAGCLKLMAEDMFPGIDATEAQRQLAHLRIDAAARRFKNRVLFALSRLAGRQRGLERFVRALAAGASHIETRFTVLGPRHYEVWINDVAGVPGFFWGMIEAGARHTGGADPMWIKAQDGDGCTYEIEGH